MSGGGRSGVVAISPPDQFPREVWEELAKQGKLKHAGGGLYELVEKPVELAVRAMQYSSRPASTCWTSSAAAAAR